MVTITLTTCGWFLLIPRKAQAQWAIITIEDIPRLITEIVERILRIIAQEAIETFREELITRVTNLILGGVTGEPAFITDWEEFLRDVPRRAAGEFLDDFFSVPGPKWANPRIETILRSTLTGEGVSLECPLSQYVDNLDDVFDQTKGGGWDLFLLALDPRCNDAGRYLMAQGGMMGAFAQKSYEQAIQGIASQGYSDIIQCEEWNCWKHEGGFVSLWHPGKCTDAELAGGGTNECVKEKIVVPGRLTAATDEYTELAYLRKLFEMPLTKPEDFAQFFLAYTKFLTSRLVREATSKIIK